MAYLGLVPSESSSGGSRAQGSITKCGNGHLRWIFNECAQHYRLPPKVSSQLTTRQQAIPKAHRRQIMEISWRCQNRLHEKGRKLAARGKTRQKVQTAIARELSAFVWEVMRAVMPKADGTHAVSTASAPKLQDSAKPTARKKGREYTLKARSAA
jgi:transposase